MAMASGALAQTSPVACGPGGVRFKVIRDQTQHPLPAPRSGGAMLYVIGAASGTVSIGIDGSWVGAVALGFLDVKSGETYYVSAITVPDGGFKLAVLHSDEGRHLLENAKFSTSSRK